MRGIVLFKDVGIFERSWLQCSVFRGKAYCLHDNAGVVGSTDGGFNKGNIVLEKGESLNKNEASLAHNNAIEVWMAEQKRKKASFHHHLCSKCLR